MCLFHKSHAWQYHLLIFLAGAQAFHTFSHIFIAFVGILPLHIYGIEYTQKLNLIVTIINCLILAVLLWWASKIGRASEVK